MAPMRYAARVDANQAEIVDAVRKAGATVWVIGLPVDTVWGFAGKTALVEIKTKVGKKSPHAAKHTELQKRFMAEWRGGTVATVTDVDGALRLLEVMRNG